MPPSAIASGQAGALRLLTLLTAWASTSSQFHKFNDNHIELALDKARLEMLQKQFQTIDNLLPGAKSDLWMTAFVQSLAGDAVGHESYKIEEAGIDHYKGVGSGMMFDAEKGKIMEHEEVDTTQALYVFNNYCGEHQEESCCTQKAAWAIFAAHNMMGLSTGCQLTGVDQSCVLYGACATANGEYVQTLCNLQHGCSQIVNDDGRMVCYDSASSCDPFEEKTHSFPWLLLLLLLLLLALLLACLAYLFYRPQYSGEVIAKKVVRSEWKATPSPSMFYTTRTTVGAVDAPGQPTAVVERVGTTGATSFL